MSVKLKTPSNGSVTLSPEDTASDVVLTVPAVAGEILNDQSDIAAAKLTGNVAAARITNALNAGGSAPLYACRAWVNFNGTTATPSTIRGSGNVSSVTKNGTGDYTVNFTTAMPDTNYCVTVGGESGPGGGNKGPYMTTFNTTSIAIFTYRDNGSIIDSAIVSVAIFR